MSNLHPVFAMALEPFVPFLANNLTAASPAIAKLIKKPRKSTETFHYCLAGVDLECELDYEAASGDGWNEPREGENAYLCEAFCGDTDIIEILSDEQREEIEVAFLEQDRSDV